MTDTYEYDVFISFASGDEDLVRPIWQDLSSSGLRVFWSDTTLKDRLGESWFNVIQQALSRSRHFLLIWTPAAASSVWVEREYVAFLNERQNSALRRMIPYLTPKADVASLPLFLRQFEACRSSDPDVAARMARLFGGVDIAALKSQIADLTRENARLADKVRELTTLQTSRASESRVCAQTASVPVAQGLSPTDSAVETVQTKDPNGRPAFVGLVKLRDGFEIHGATIWNFHPAYGGGGRNEESVGVCTSVEAAANHDTNRTRALLFRKIARITMIPLGDEEQQRVKQFDSYSRQALLKCDVEFHAGNAMRGVFLMPHTFKYRSDVEEGDIRQDTVVSVIFTANAG